MAEDEEEVEELDFDEFMEAIEEQRRERREQVSYEWVETVREAGELYRESEDTEAVAEDLGRSEERTREAVTVYRLIFEEPPEEVAMKASMPGRAFFSLDQEVEEAVDEEEPVEDLLREYVGAIYLEYNVGEEPVGDPPEETTPPPAVDFSEIGEQIAESFTFPTATILAAARISELQTNILEPFAASQASILANITEPIAAQQANMLANAVEPVIAHQERRVSSMIAASLPDLTKQLQLQQSVVNSAISGELSNAVADIQFPEPLLADLASIQPAINAAAAAGAGSTPPATGRTVADEPSTTTVEAEPLEATASTVPPTGPANATLDATLPDSDAFSAEFVFDIPSMMVQAMLSTGQARTWFTNLDEDHQITVVRFLLAAVAVYITKNPFYASIAILPERSVRRAIVDDERED
ncbi:hypothetical protein [Haloarcula pellucida]|uniref:Uncharacterized protein n=1 Tax=Haloarcula pellucida TaxID=1427151 RepID=A0A830GMM4_9EURY|nr:hypothetical protein [Halomicroarcula pellucida]MBX0347928.1 hypothetical protein [Halomicroarcula pellucida]GGN96102.1 hypothetical protein GCM10009030_24010 [Halomicroarcula pellucida]